MLEKDLFQVEMKQIILPLTLNRKNEILLDVEKN
jgi:hypothetical protein